LYQRARGDEKEPTAGLASGEADRAQQQADALALLAETALHQELDPGAPGERYQVVVHVDAAVLANSEHPGQSVLEEMGHVPAETAKRLGWAAPARGAAPRSPARRSRPRSAATTMRSVSGSAHARRALAGSASGWIWAGPSTSCVLGPRAPETRADAELMSAPPD
jgi:hypothetical protein